MGLDMYFSRRTYVSSIKKDDEGNWVKQDVNNMELKFDDADLSHINLKNVRYIEEIFGEFRKFNALHGYVVDNFGGGRDECQVIYLDIDDLIQIHEMLSLVQESLSIGDKVIAEQTLPPQAGFFFGSTEIDEWYEEAVKEAVEVFGKVIEEHSIVGYNASYSYQASW
jgi:predicted DNA-binding transcriptional regulator AlpA|tara:strand:- start:814 stop:1314 length:501 start_codon:yes stop_codon:yes gene_type:complete